MILYFLTAILPCTPLPPHQPPFLLLFPSSPCSSVPTIFLKHHRQHDQTPLTCSPLTLYKPPTVPFLQVYKSFYLKSELLKIQDISKKHQHIFYQPCYFPVFFYFNKCTKSSPLCTFSDNTQCHCLFQSKFKYTTTSFP